MDYKVLIVEDEKLLREVLTDLFVSKGDTPLKPDWQKHTLLRKEILSEI